jgi:hypothetical protein
MHVEIELQSLAWNMRFQVVSCHVSTDTRPLGIEDRRALSDGMPRCVQS